MYYIFVCVCRILLPFLLHIDRMTVYVQFVQGVLSCRGEKILMVDADGATKFSDLDKVERALDELKGGKENMAISVGSRAHLQDDAVAQVCSLFLACFFIDVHTPIMVLPFLVYIPFPILYHNEVRINPVPFDRPI